ncbi:hypothetical protein Tco_0943061, partial [Tanacetum coccineum]
MFMELLLSDLVRLGSDGVGAWWPWADRYDGAGASSLRGGLLLQKATPCGFVLYPRDVYASGGGVGMTSLGGVEGNVELFNADVGLPGARIKLYEAIVGLFMVDASGVFMSYFRRLHAMFQASADLDSLSFPERGFDLSPEGEDEGFTVKLSFLGADDPRGNGVYEVGGVEK